MKISLIILGSIILLHDILYHLGYVKGIGIPVLLKGFHFHHGYFGAILIIVGVII